MTGIWLASYIILWLLVIVGGVTLLALAKEILQLHKQLEEMRPYIFKKETEDQK